MPTFLELDESRLRDAVVILDIDGTITHDKNESIERNVEEKIRRIARHAHLYLSSNGDLARTKRFADQLGVGFVDTRHKKPNRRVLESISHDGVRRIVIGDKALTDGLLALNTGAEFIPVARIRHERDSNAARAMFVIDDIASSGIRRLFPLLQYIVLMRPIQWIKNALVFAPLFFAGGIFSAEKLFNTGIATAVFCLLASAMYILNDIHDREQDRLHPTKRGRPIASGAISVSAAYTFFACLLILAASGMWLIQSALPVFAVYFALNALYSRYLKHVAVLDVILVAVFYILRVIAGGVAANVFISPWIVLVVFFGALFLAVGKRRVEFARSARRKVLESYSQGALDFMLVSAATLSVISYGIYTVFGGHSEYAVYSTLFVCTAILLLLNRMYRSDADAEYPESLVFKDRLVLGITCAWALFMFILLYLP